MDTPLFYTFLFVHLISLIIGFGAVIVIDTMGLLWLLKKAELKFLVKVADITQALVWTGWTGLVFSGLVLITSKGYIDNLTWIKIFFVLMLGVNGLFLHLIKGSIAVAVRTGVVTPILKFRIGLTTAISQLGWWGAITIGFLHRHWQHKIDWPESIYPYIIAIILIFSVTAIVGEYKFNKQ
ncbi:MAG TPA: hypothetical protein VD998_01690 [Verrucomicrobiae bacterium]|nr:hypothetical protein [Verrucomicrobiae bacterium]